MTSAIDPLATAAVEFESLAFTRLAESDDFAAAQEAARTHGFAAGYADGARRAAEEYEARRAELEATAAAQAEDARQSLERQNALLEWVIDALEMRLTPAVEQAQASLAAAALELAEAVIGVELASDEASARSIVARVLGAVDVSDAVTAVRVNPAESALVRAQLGERAGMRIVADAAIAPGDAIAELPDGFLDARIRTALSRARAALAEAAGPHASAAAPLAADVPLAHDEEPDKHDQASGEGRG